MVMSVICVADATAAGSWQGKEEERDHFRSIKVFG